MDATHEESTMDKTNQRPVHAKQGTPEIQKCNELKKERCFKPPIVFSQKASKSIFSNSPLMSVKTTNQSTPGIITPGIGNTIAGRVNVEKEENSKKLKNLL
jgi:hypothetical protein